MSILFFDENIKLELATTLRERGVDVRTTREESRLGALDADQLLHCAGQGWVLVTQYRKDFEPLHEGWLTWTAAWNIRSEHSGILALDQGPLVPELTEPIIQLLSSDRPLVNRL